jgi:hypothetical protein
MTAIRNGADIIEHEIGLDGELTLRLHTGTLEIHATDGTTARVRDLDGHGLEERFQVERGPGRLGLRPRDRVILDLGFVKRGRGGGRIAVELPRRASLSVDTASADVHADGLGGEQRYRTASGDVALSRVSGPIGVDAVSGSVTIEADGGVDLSGRLVSGDLRLTGGRLLTVAVGTTSGDVALHAPLDGPGPYSLQTVSGDVEAVGGRRGLRVEAKTLTGDITSDLPNVSDSGRGRRTLVIGDGAATLAFKSISGDLRITSHVPGSGEAVSPAPPESSAIPDLPVRPVPRAPTAAPAWPAQPVDASADPRLRILRDLEAGAIDIDTATRRLTALEDEGEAGA